MADVVVVGALVRDGRVLLVHRRAGRRHFPDCWDLPGGHVEPGEGPTDALVRELREELGVEATVTGPSSLHVEHEPHHDDGLLLDVWTVSSWTGEPVNAAPDEHDGLRWVTSDELGGLDVVHPPFRAFLTELLVADLMPFSRAGSFSADDHWPTTEEHVAE